MSRRSKRYSKNKSGNFGKKKRSTSNHKKEILSFARKMGQVERGLKNPDSQITASYNSGVQKADRTKKPLY